MSDKKRVRLTVTLPADVHAAMQQWAAKHERSLNGEIAWALRFHVGLLSSRPDAEDLIRQLANHLEEDADGD